MRRRRNKWRVSGPTKHGRKWRLQFARGSGEARQIRYETFDARADAEAAYDAAVDFAQGTTVRQAMEQFLAEKRARGLAESTLESYGERLLLLLGPVLSRPIRVVLTRAAALYECTWVGVGGRPRAADTHQHALMIGGLWARWCVARGLLKSDPFADVIPIGRRVVGADKPRLTVDESRQLEAWCLAHPEDQGAALTLGYLYLGSRAGELVRSEVRDLDDGGNLLWIRVTKTAAGRRRLAIPAALRELLLAMAAGRAPDAALFAREDGTRLSRDSARRHVVRVTAAAGVTVLPPQALRRTQATLATEAGETALAVARHLGHATGGAPAVTGRSYVGRDAAAGARGERALKLLQGGRP
jgi:integrase